MRPRETGNLEYKPINHPSYPDKSLRQVHDEHAYLDSSSVEGADEIIHRIIRDQLNKIRPLLDRALKKSKRGSADRPIRLGTVCSGTDAPCVGVEL